MYVIINKEFRKSPSTSELPPGRLDGTMITLCEVFFSSAQNDEIKDQLATRHEPEDLNLAILLDNHLRKR